MTDVEGEGAEAGIVIDTGRPDAQTCALLDVVLTGLRDTVVLNNLEKLTTQHTSNLLDSVALGYCDVKGQDVRSNFHVPFHRTQQDGGMVWTIELVNSKPVVTHEGFHASVCVPCPLDVDDLVAAHSCQNNTDEGQHQLFRFGG